MFKLWAWCAVALAGGLNAALIESDIAMPDVTSTKGQAQQSFLVDKTLLWPRGIVKYRFETLDHDDGNKEEWFDETDKAEIRSAMDHISEKVPCIRFM